MAVLQGGTTGDIAEVGAGAAKGMHAILKPDAYGAFGHYRCATKSGTIAAALAADSELFQFRWTDPTELAIIQGIWVSAVANLAATAAGMTSLEAWIARGWTVDGSGGNFATLSSNNQKMRTSMGSPQNGIRFATTGALGAGTKSLDLQAIGMVGIGIGTGAITTTPNLELLGMTNLLPEGFGSHPIVLAQNEGFVIRNGLAFPATMTWQLTVTVAWMELAAY